MAKSRLSKRQIAGALLLSSTAIGTTASGTASANAFTKFISGKANYGYNWVTNLNVGKVIGARLSNLQSKLYIISINKVRKKLKNNIEELQSIIKKNSSIDEYSKSPEMANALSMLISSINGYRTIDFESLKQKYYSYIKFKSLKQKFKDYINETKEIFSKIEKEYKTYTEYLSYILSIDKKREELSDNIVVAKEKMKSNQEICSEICNLESSLKLNNPKTDITSFDKLLLKLENEKNERNISLRTMRKNYVEYVEQAYSKKVNSNAYLIV